MWLFLFYQQKTAYEMRISDWSSDVCSSDLVADVVVGPAEQHRIDALLDQAADHRRLGAGKAEAAGERGQRVAAVGIRRRAEVVGEQDRKSSWRERVCPYV